MIPMVREWIPNEAVLCPAIHEKITQIIFEWESDWFFDCLYTVSHIKLGRIEGNEKRGTWRTFCAPVQLHCPPRASQILLERALDYSEQSMVTPQSAIEKDVLKRFEAHLFTDLSERIARALIADPASFETLNSPKGGTGERALVATLSDGRGSDLLSIAIPSIALVPFVKRSLPPRPATKLADVSLDSLLGDRKIRLEALLGNARIRVGDLRDLTPGDVMVLDTRCDAGCEIRTVTSQRHIASAKPVEHENAATLIIETL